MNYTILLCRHDFHARALIPYAFVPFMLLWVSVFYALMLLCLHAFMLSCFYAAMILCLSLAIMRRGDRCSLVLSYATLRCRYSSHAQNTQRYKPWLQYCEGRMLSGPELRYALCKCKYRPSIWYSVTCLLTVRMLRVCSPSSVFTYHA